MERSLEGAKQSIDLLESLERKTRGNLTPDEEKTLQEILTNLRLNYVDELKKEQAGGAEAEAADGPAGAGEEETQGDKERGEGEEENVAGAGD
jgi:hypothetical protein